jgi:hypothetical protein
MSEHTTLVVKQPLIIWYLTVSSSSAQKKVKLLHITKRSE